jgi:esterase/lipase
MMKNRTAFFSKRTPLLEARHYASGLNSQFNSDQLSFADYVSTSRDMIRKVRVKADPAHLDHSSLDQTIDGNAPFDLLPSGGNAKGKAKPWRRGILLTHGLSDSPYFMRHLAAFFQANDFRVMAVLLPGHGTQPGDLLNVRWQEWARTVAYGTEQLAAEVDELYLGGYSAGGALSILQSLQDERVRGLFLFAPAIDITHRARYACLHKLVSWLIPRAKWLELKPDHDIYKYESFAKNTATQMYQLTLALHSKLQQHELKIPIFTVASIDDKTVDAQATVAFMAGQKSPRNKFILYSSDVAKSSSNTPDIEIEWVNSFIPEQKILGSAHTAILVHPGDGHYGVEGDYANCIHYYPHDMEKYEACTRYPQACWLGEITEKNLAAGVLRRLMYNPGFDALKDSLQQFIRKFP